MACRICVPSGNDPRIAEITSATCPLAGPAGDGEDERPNPTRRNPPGDPEGAPRPSRSIRRADDRAVRPVGGRPRPLRRYQAALAYVASPQLVELGDRGRL